MTEPSNPAGPAYLPPDRLLRLLVESVEDYAIFVLDPGGHVASWNTGAARLKGYAAAEIVGKHFSIFYPPEQAHTSKCDDELAAAASAGRFEDEGWRVRKDGSRFWANVVITALRDEAGALVGFAKITRDLTERRLAEERRLLLAQAEQAARLKDEFLAREREARRAVDEARSSLATTLRSIGDAVMATDESGNVTIMNPVAERLTGWSVDEALGVPLRTVFHIINEGTRRLVESPVDRVLREGAVVGLANHTLLLARDGTETPIHDSGAPIRDESGNIRGVVLVFRDASVEARENGRRVFLAEATTVLGSSLDSRETLARIADVAVPRLADWCMVDVLDDERGAPVCVGAAHADPQKTELVHDLGRRYRPEPNEKRGIIRVLRTGRAELYPAVTAEQVAKWARDEEQRRLLRELRMSSVMIVPLVTPRRVVGAMTLVYADSGRRYTAEDLSLVEELGRRAGTAIENARLYTVEQRARDLADSTSRMKDEFLATVSHELRTPLSAILGWVRMLSTAQMTEDKRRRAIETIERNARAMTQLIEDLLDVSRIVSGKMRIEVGRVDLAVVLQSAVESVRPAAEAKEIALELDGDDDAGLVRGDAARLQQVVWNLLVNAVKFTPRGGRVSVSLGRRDSEAEVVVRDTGIGIEPRFVPHIFEPFRQADASIRRTTGGLGLGLAIVKHLVEQHGGSVEAQSDGQNRGATFVVRLPVAAAIGGATERTSPVPQASAPPPDLQNVRVLVVDDDVDTREMLREILGGSGARVTLAGSVAEAIEAFTREPPDVLISDIGMPGETGFDSHPAGSCLAGRRGRQSPGGGALRVHTRVRPALGARRGIRAPCRQARGRRRAVRDRGDAVAVRRTTFAQALLVPPDDTAIVSCNRPMMREKPLAPGPKGTLLGGNFREVTADWLGTLTRYAREYGDVYSYRLGPQRGVMLSDPKLIEEVLAPKTNIFKKPPPEHLIRPLGGNGIFLSEGEFWKRQRRLVSPPFHKQALATYGEWMVRIAEGIAGKFEDGETRDVFEDTTRLALEVVSRVLFDADVNAEAAHVGRALTQAMAALSLRLNSPVPLPDWVPTPAMRQLRAATRELDAVVYGFIAKRRASASRGAANPKDLLSLLLSARDETDGQGMSDEQVRDEAMTLFVAGFETTAITLAWALWLLATHPHVAGQLRAEVDGVLAGRAPTSEDLPRLPFTDGVVREALRLYPPAWATLREVTEDFEIGGYRVPKGFMVGACQWVTHRDPRYWDRPQAFDPSRWQNDLAKRLPRFAYFPFGGGPRICIGNAFAMMEAVLVIATFASQLEFEPVERHSPTPKPGFTLRPEPGVVLRVRRRIRARVPSAVA